MSVINSKTFKDIFEITHYILNLENPIKKKKILQRIAHKALIILKADIITIYEYYSDKEEIDIYPTIVGDIISPINMKQKVSSVELPYDIIRKNQSYFIQNLKQEFPQRENIVSTGAILLKAGNEVMGVMFANYRTRIEFSHEERQLLEFLAIQAAIVIKNCRMIQQISKLHPENQNKIKSFSCFISYSTKDEEFAQKIYSELQYKGIPCWIAPENMKIGDEIRSSIDKAIISHDKLLLILSENSVESEWVKKEVETAFEQEKINNRTMLIPIMIDNSVMESNQAWASDIRRMRNIGDFTNWNNQFSYKKSFEKLVRDLKQETPLKTKTSKKE